MASTCIVLWKTVRVRRKREAKHWRCFWKSLCSLFAARACTTGRNVSTKHLPGLEEASVDSLRLLIQELRVQKLTMLAAIYHVLLRTEVVGKEKV